MLRLLLTEIDVNGSVLWPLLRKFAVYSFLLFHIFMTGYVLIEDERFACEEMNRMMRKLRPDFISRNRKNRFLVQVGDSYQHIGIKDIAYFYSEEKYTFLHLFTGGRYVIGYSLDQLEGILDPGMFFHVSRHGIGLRNLMQQYMLHGKEIRIIRTPDTFTVVLPYV